MQSIITPFLEISFTLFVILSVTTFIGIAFYLSMPLLIKAYKTGFELYCGWYWLLAFVSWKRGNYLNLVQAKKYIEKAVNDDIMFKNGQCKFFRKY